MPTASRTPFPYPLQIGVMDHFCRPTRGHLLAVPRWHRGMALAASGWFAIRATRGLWMRDGSDFPPADAPFLARFNKLPWDTFEKIIPRESEWRPLHDARLFRHGPLATWLHGRPSPSPVWRVAEQHLVRLSHLQLISRLPRCEVFAGTADREAPLFFRFSGGMGIIARDETLTSPSHCIFAPKRHDDGALVERRRTPVPSLGLPGWPPPPCD